MLFATTRWEDTKIHYFLVRQKEKYFYCKRGQIVHPKRLCGKNHPGKCSSAKYKPEKTDLVSSASSSGLEQVNPEGSFQHKLFHGCIIHKIRVLLLAM